MKTVKFAMIIALGMVCLSGYAVRKKQLLVVEDTPTNSTERSNRDRDDDKYKDFPRLLLMQISKAGVFRCIDRTTYRMQAKELALGDSGDVEFSSAGYCISWIIRPRETARGVILTVSLGCNNIGKSGNNELLMSEDVKVYEKNLKGEDLLTAAARKSARAILFRLRPPEVMEVEKLKSGKTKVLVDYGRDFLSIGTNAKFIRKKVSSSGREITRQVGTGVVRAVDTSASAFELLNGTVAEGDTVDVVDYDTEAVKSGVCPVCDGKRKIRIDVKCDGCNGQGKVWFIRSGLSGMRTRSLSICRECHGKGVRSMDKICDECGGSGKSE